MLKAILGSTAFLAAPCVVGGVVGGPRRGSGPASVVAAGAFVVLQAFVRFVREDAVRRPGGLLGSEETEWNRAAVEHVGDVGPRVERLGGVQIA